MAADGAIQTSVAAGLARITIDRREKRNALDRATTVALTAALERCERDPAVRVVQITGPGMYFAPEQTSPRCRRSGTPARRTICPMPRG